MASFLELGLTAGRALPAPTTAAATNGMVYNPAGLWTYPPGYLLAVDAGGAGTPLNTTGETSVLNAAMTGALPAFVAVGDAVHLRAWGQAAFGATGTLTFNVYAGATKIVAGAASANYSSGTPRGWLIDLWIHLLSATTVSAEGMMLPRGTTPSGFNGLTAASDLQFAGNDDGNAVTVSTLPQAIDIKAITSVSTATTQVSCKGATARYFAKGY